MSLPKHFFHPLEQITNCAQRTTSRSASRFPDRRLELSCRRAEHVAGPTLYLRLPPMSPQTSCRCPLSTPGTRMLSLQMEPHLSRRNWHLLAMAPLTASWMGPSEGATNLPSLALFLRLLMAASWPHGVPASRSRGPPGCPRALSSSLNCSSTLLKLPRRRSSCKLSLIQPPPIARPPHRHRTVTYPSTIALALQLGRTRLAAGTVDSEWGLQRALLLSAPVGGARRRLVLFMLAPFASTKALAATKCVVS